jgi:hypothetical protein
MYEHLGAPLLPRRVFAIRLLKNAGIAAAMLVASLAIGTVGYRSFEDLSWVDAFLNASMILNGMGPVDTLHTTGGKIFAALYAIYSGLAFLTIVAVLLAPIIHRGLHRFHLAAKDK